MKQIPVFIAACAIVLFAPSVFGQAQEAPKPCIEVIGSADFDFGTIEQDANVKHVFELKNTCSDSIHIASAQASCGCTAAIVSNKDLGPGEKASIEVKFHPPAGTRNSVTKTVSVYLRDVPTPATVLRISAKVVTELETDPQYIQILGMVVGKEASGKVTVKNSSAADIELAEITANMTAYVDTTSGSNGSSTVAVQLEGVKVGAKSKMLKPGESTDVTISFVPKYAGQLNGSIIIKTKKSQIYVQAFGSVKASEAVEKTTTTNAPAHSSKNDASKQH